MARFRPEIATAILAMDCGIWFAFINGVSAFHRMRLARRHVMLQMNFRTGIAMQSTILSFANIHEHGGLFENFFRGRWKCFILQRNWDLPEENGMEFDQYDTPQSRWIAIHEEGDARVLGGFRLTPSTARCGVYSYMIRDAALGTLGGSIPQDLLWSEAPVDPKVWECTRVFVDDDIPQGLRRKLHLRMVDAMMQAARAMGAEKLVALTDANWPRWYGRRGLSAAALGPVLQIDDGRFQTVAIEVPGAA